MLHPCKTTLISSTQTLPNLIYSFGSPALLSPFSAFADSVASDYATPGLCSLTYSIGPAANAVAFGVTVLTTPSLEI